MSQLREWLDTPEEYLTEGGAPIPRSADGQYTIQLQDVSFRYPGAEHDTIRHLDLTLAGQEDGQLFTDLQFQELGYSWDSSSLPACV